jgi:hypothetical protein
MLDRLREKSKIIISAMICVTLIILGILFWPTFYRYDKIEDKIEGKMPVRINRITGYTEILYTNGWKPVETVQTMPQDKKK